MQLANLTTFESGAFEMPKSGGLTDVGIKDMPDLTPSRHRWKDSEWFMIACLEINIMSDKTSKLGWLSSSLFDYYSSKGRELSCPAW